MNFASYKGVHRFICVFKHGKINCNKVYDKLFVLKVWTWYQVWNLYVQAFLYYQSVKLFVFKVSVTMTW